MKQRISRWLLGLLAALMVFGLTACGGTAEVPPAEPEEASSSPDRLAAAELIAGGVILALFLYEVLSADKNGSKIFLGQKTLFLKPLQ